MTLGLGLPLLDASTAAGSVIRTPGAWQTEDGGYWKTEDGGFWLTE